MNIDIFINDVINYVINRGVPHSHPRLGLNKHLHVESRKNTYESWKEAKQLMNFGSNDTLVVHCLSHLSQPLSSLSPLDQT